MFIFFVSAPSERYLDIWKFVILNDIIIQSKKKLIVGRIKKL